MQNSIILNQYNILPENLKLEVNDFIGFLIYKNNISIGENSNSKRNGYGSRKGDYIMSDDFNEPLEDFKEYMI